MVKEFLTKKDNNVNVDDFIQHHSNRQKRLSENGLMDRIISRKQTNEESQVDNFFNDKINQKRLLKKIVFSLIEMKNKKIELQAIKKLIDMHLDIDIFNTKNDVELYNLVESMLK